MVRHLKVLTGAITEMINSIAYPVKKLKTGNQVQVFVDRQMPEWGEFKEIKPT